MMTGGAIRSAEEWMLKGIIRFDPQLWVVIQHSQNEISKFNVICCRVPGITKSYTSRPTSVHAQDIMKRTTAWFPMMLLKYITKV